MWKNFVIIFLLIKGGLKGVKRDEFHIIIKRKSLLTFHSTCFRDFNEEKKREKNMIEKGFLFQLKNSDFEASDCLLYYETHRYVLGLR
jgi:hypothetical protein